MAAIFEQPVQYFCEGSVHITRQCKSNSAISIKYQNQKGIPCSECKNAMDSNKMLQ